MKSWQYEIGDVLIIKRKDQEQPARIAGFEDSLDNTTALYVNLRTPKGSHWSVSEIKIMPKQIIRYVLPWQEDEVLKRSIAQ